MRWVVAGLSYVNFATIAAVVLGTLGGGLHRSLAVISLFVGLAAACGAFLTTPESVRVPATEPETPPSLRRKRKPGVTRKPPLERYRGFWFWFMLFCFAGFALRSFSWLFYIDSNEFKIQSPNNLGDLGLHLTYIKYFASGVPLWPPNPIYLLGRLRYPAGIDIFNSVLTLSGLDLRHGLTWTALLGSAATFYGLYRWSGTFGIAGFLFNGGVAGFAIFRAATRLSFLDYQGDKTVAWKSLALSMLVTQRGLLYALPAGLVLLCHWRRKFFPDANVAEPARGGLLPRWVEISLYATMPLFHAHTFIALSILLAFFFVFGAREVRRETLLVVAAAIIPATFFVWEISDHFHAGSMLKWKPGWVQQPPGEMARPFVAFWLFNFGLWVPLTLLFVGLVGWQAWLRRKDGRPLVDAQFVFIAGATFLFLFACLVKTAPWEWDNLKIIIWAYLIMLPFLWSSLIARWPLPARGAICLLLFFSGFVTLIGGLAAGRTGFGIADRGEVAMVANAVRKLPPTARFAGYPTYNHPVLLSGRPMLLGYPGHLWTQGVDYEKPINKLREAMLGSTKWRESLLELGARYLFWGREEKANYAGSAKPWERQLQPVESGSWGAIYDLQLATPPGATAGQR